MSFGDVIQKMHTPPYGNEPVYPAPVISTVTQIRSHSLGSEPSSDSSDKSNKILVFLKNKWESISFRDIFPSFNNFFAWVKHSFRCLGRSPDCPRTATVITDQENKPGKASQEILFPPKNPTVSPEKAADLPEDRRKKWADNLRKTMAALKNLGAEYGKLTKGANLVPEYEKLTKALEDFSYEPNWDKLNLVRNLCNASISSIQTKLQGNKELIGFEPTLQALVSAKTIIRGCSQACFQYLQGK